MFAGSLFQRDYTPSDWLKHTDTPMGQFVKPRLVSEHTVTINDVAKVDGQTITYANDKGRYQSINYDSDHARYIKTTQANSPRVKLHYQTIKFAYPTQGLQDAMLLDVAYDDASASHTIKTLVSVDIYLSPSDYAKYMSTNWNRIKKT